MSRGSCLVLVEVVVLVVVGELGHVVVLPGVAGGLHPSAMVVFLWILFKLNF